MAVYVPPEVIADHRARRGDTGGGGPATVVALADHRPTAAQLIDHAVWCWRRGLRRYG